MNDQVLLVSDSNNDRIRAVATKVIKAQAIRADLSHMVPTG